MKNTILSSILLALLCASFNASAKDEANDFSDSDSKLETLSAEKLRYTFEIVGEILAFDGSGKRLLYQVPEKRTWNFRTDQPMGSNWSFKHSDLPEIALHHVWDVNKSGQLVATIAQYDHISRGKNGEVKYGKLLSEKSFVVENFDAIDWVVENTKDRRVLVKFSPRLWTAEKSENIGAVGLNGKDITIYDNNGDLWASDIDNTEGNNVYFGITTHKGSVYLSYLPFKGAKEIGVANAKGIKIQDGQTKLKIKNRDPFLPTGITAKVYGYIDLNRRTDRPFSIRSYGSDKEANFVKNIMSK